MKKLLTISAILLLILGCDEEINFDLDGRNPNFMVIDGWWVSDQGPYTIQLTRTRDYLNDPVAQNVEGAAVEVNYEGSLFTFSETQPGIYTSPAGFNLEPGKEVDIKLIVDGEEHQYSGESEDEVEIETVFIDNEDGNRFITVVFDPEDEEQAFAITKLYRGEINGNDTTWISLDTNTPLNMQSVDYNSGERLYSDNSDFQTLASGTVVRFEIHIFSSNDFQYINTLQQELDGDIFSVQPANPSFVFTNEALGTVFMSTAHTTILEVD